MRSFSRTACCTTTRSPTGFASTQWFPRPQRFDDVEDVPVPDFKPDEIVNIERFASAVARPRFARGLCALHDGLVAGGSSPSTISVYDMRAGTPSPAAEPVDGCAQCHSRTGRMAVRIGANVRRKSGKRGTREHGSSAPDAGGLSSNDQSAEAAITIAGECLVGQTELSDLDGRSAHGARASRLRQPRRENAAHRRAGRRRRGIRLVLLQQPALRALAVFIPLGAARCPPSARTTMRRNFRRRCRPSPITCGAPATKRC